MNKENLYKVLPLKNIQEEWFGNVVQSNLKNCRKSLDGSLVILKLPSNINSEEDITDEKLKADFIAFKPYLSHREALELMATSKWQAQAPFNVETVIKKRSSTISSEEIIILPWYIRLLNWIKLKLQKKS